MGVGAGVGTGVGSGTGVGVVAAEGTGVGVGAGEGGSGTGGDSKEGEVLAPAKGGQVLEVMVEGERAALGSVKEVPASRAMRAGATLKLMEAECPGVRLGGAIWARVGIMVGRVGVFVLDWEAKANVKMKGCSLGTRRVTTGDGNSVEKG